LQSLKTFLKKEKKAARILNATIYFGKELERVAAQKPSFSPESSDAAKL